MPQPRQVLPRQRERHRPQPRWRFQPSRCSSLLPLYDAHRTLLRCSKIIVLQLRRLMATGNTTTRSGRDCTHEPRRHGRQFLKTTDRHLPEATDRPIPEPTDRANREATDRGISDRTAHPRATLILACLAQFMVILDVSVVNVALPSIRDALHFSEANLQWVVDAYTVTFGGFLLLGGRAADLIGRRRVFVAGLALFALTSLLAALASSEE